MLQVQSLSGLALVICCLFYLREGGMQSQCLFLFPYHAGKSSLYSCANPPGHQLNFQVQWAPNLTRKKKKSTEASSYQHTVLSYPMGQSQQTTWGTNPTHLVREGGSLLSMSKVQILNFCWKRRLCSRTCRNILSQDCCKCNACFL